LFLGKTRKNNKEIKFVELRGENKIKKSNRMYRIWCRYSHTVPLYGSTPATICIESAFELRLGARSTRYYNNTQNKIFRILSISIFLTENILL
jgi:hypothetical protein